MLVALNLEHVMNVLFLLFLCGRLIRVVSCLKPQRRRVEKAKVQYFRNSQITSGVGGVHC